MGGIRDHIQEGPVHTRSMDIRTYPAKDGRLVVEGRLRDERLVPGTRWDGRIDSPGVIHHMVLRFLMKRWPPVILEVEADMQSVPNELCPTTLDAVQRLVGLAVVPGYGKAVQERIGGVEGCTHLAHLAGVMGMAALHGAWMQQRREPQPLPASPEDIPGIEQLVNSCRLWREDGPILKAFRKELEDLQRSAGGTGGEECGSR